MLDLDLKRPLVVLDIEATGLSVRTDRIVEICLVKVGTDKKETLFTRRINPGFPIPPEAIAIHHITDADVADSPSFVDLAREIFDFLEGCDLAGYNAANFDVPLLVEEFIRAKMVFNPADRSIVDPQRIFYKKEPRDLSAALKFFCGETLKGAHGAEADAVATLHVLEGQLAKYGDLPTDIAGLAQFSDTSDPTWADQTGRLKWVNGEITINFGKKKGESLRRLTKDDTGYLKWILKSDFARDTQEIIRKALNDDFPAAPTQK